MGISLVRCVQCTLRIRKNAMAQKKKILISNDLPLFAELTADELEIVSDLMTEQVVEAGDVLFSEGDPAGDIFIILDGIVRVNTQIVADVEKTLLTLRKGGVFGEMAMLTGESRSGTARAVEKTTVAAFSADAFKIIRAEHPAIAAKLMDFLVHTASKRLRHTTDMYKQAEQWSLSISGAVELNYSQLIAEYVTVRIDLNGSTSVTGMIVKVETSSIGTELLIKTADGKFVIVPYRSVVSISFDTDGA